MPTNSQRDASMVYIVDDGADYRFMVQKVFTQFLPQYKVILFPGGNALLQHLQTNPVLPSLILLDLHMPGMSGLQTLTQLKQEQPENGSGAATTAPAAASPTSVVFTPTSWPVRSIPVVVVTSSSSAREIQACYEAGANSCLAKPVGFDPLRQRLTLICDYWMNTNRTFLA
ncbi:response regulator [Spirosoma arcticum]